MNLFSNNNIINFGRTFQIAMTIKHMHHTVLTIWLPPSPYKNCHRYFWLLCGFHLIILGTFLRFCTNFDNSDSWSQRFINNVDHLTMPCIRFDKEIFQACFNFWKYELLNVDAKIKQGIYRIWKNLTLCQISLFSAVSILKKFRSEIRHRGDLRCICQYYFCLFYAPQKNLKVFF